MSGGFPVPISGALAKFSLDKKKSIKSGFRFKDMCNATPNALSAVLSASSTDNILAKKQTVKIGMVDRMPSHHAAAALLGLLRLNAGGSIRSARFGASFASTSYHTLTTASSQSSKRIAPPAPTRCASSVRSMSSSSSLRVSAHRKQAGREKARLRSMRQEEKQLRRREKDGFPASNQQQQHQQHPRRPRDPLDEEVEANMREYMARTGPRGERLTRAQQERLLKHELKGLGHQLEKLEKKAQADQATQDLPELDDHTLEELYQALMLPPPPTAEEARLARLEGGRREKGLQKLVEDGRGRRRLGGMEVLQETRAEERRRRAGMDLKQRMIDAREKGRMLLPPSSTLPRMEEPMVTEEVGRSEAVAEEETEMAALPYAERQEVRLQQLFARLAMVHPSVEASKSDQAIDSLQEIKSNLASRIAKILQQHDYELHSTPAHKGAAEANVSEDSTQDTAILSRSFWPVRLDGRAPALSDGKFVDTERSNDAMVGSRGDLITRAETMIRDLGSVESRSFMLDSIEKLVRSASPATSSSTTARLPLGVATTDEWTALAVASARANDAASLSRTVALMQDAGYYPAPLTLYNDVMDVFASNGQVAACQEWLQQMTTAGLAPDDHTYHSLTKAYVNTAQFMPAIQLLNSLETSGRPASMATYTLVIDRLLDPITIPQSGVQEERPELQALAWNVFYHMRLHAHPVPDAPLYTLMIRACARGVPQPHDIDDPSSKYTGLDLSSWSSSNSRTAPVARISDAERALDLFREMTTRYSVRPNAEVYNALILACARRRDFYLEAFRLLREMVELETERGHLDDNASGGMLRFAPDRYTFNALLQGCARNRDLARARWVLAEMIRTTLPLFDAEVRQGLKRDERMELLSKRPNEETMCHVFHTYAAYEAPVKRDQIALQSGQASAALDSSSSTADANTHDSTEAAAQSPTLSDPQQNNVVASETEDDSTTPEEAAHIFSSLVPQTSSDLVSETRSLFARILADQPSSSSATEGPLGSVTPGVRLVNAYLTVLAAHLAPHQRASVLHAALLPQPQQGAQDEAGLEHGLFAKLGLEANEHSYRIVLESLSEADASTTTTTATVVEEVWSRFRQYVARQTIGVDSTAVSCVNDGAPGQHLLDAVQITKCWSAYMHYHAKNAQGEKGLDKVVSLLREFVSLYPPTLASEGTKSSSGRKKQLKKQRMRQMAQLKERATLEKLDLSPLPVPWTSLQSLVALSSRTRTSTPPDTADTSPTTTGGESDSGPSTTLEHPATVDAPPPPAASTPTPLSSRPHLTFLDVQLLHHRLVRYGYTKHLAYLSWVLHRYAAAAKLRRPTQ